MRASIFFYVSRRGTSRPFAVPVHLVNGTGPWQVVRALAGRDAGGTFTVTTNDLHHLPGNARLVPGSREAIAKYGPRQLEAAMAARALRKRIGSWRGRLTDRQLRNAFDQMLQLAESVRPRTSHDRAWLFFDKDLNDWNERGDERGDGGALVIRMIDMILGAASRYEPPPIDQGSSAYARAEMLDANANALFTRTLGLGFGDPEPWRKVVDAFEVSEDAWREAGDDDRADRLAERRHNILDTVRDAYGPRRQR